MRMLPLIAAALLSSAAAQEVPAEDHYAEEIARLTGEDAVQEAFAAIDAMRERSIADLIEIVETPAPPFKEEARGELVARMFEETGFGDVSVDEVGNVIARREGRSGERSVAVLAHIDTVFPEGTDVTVTREGNTFTAPGIGDNARGVVLLLELARAIEAADIETEADILLVGNVGEEGLGDLRGVKHLFREGADHPDAVLAIDGSDLSRLVTAAVGSNRYRVTYKGPGGHSWSDFGAPNPHHALGRAIAYLDEMALPVTQEGPKSSYSVGRISGGTSVNSIPFESTMEVDMRSGDPERLALVDAAFQEAMERALEVENREATQGEPLTLTVEPIGKRPAAKGDLSAPLVQHALAALRSEGIQPTPAASSTDANLPLSLGVPAVTMARGGISEGAHSAAESWTDEDTARATRAALLTLLAEAGY
ncbi:M20/M25/M40 family metallo-hydrolase [Parvularcula oceani]|uniref:M20/M25/M40 family metallo-hydrolase n=1 Tax=Parvularcula oceani TaxID=1247963 RepID=UPI00056D0F75|nr:M20/M25/M40 family metallo-hydrolase [Parvularcula oceani]